MKMRNRGSDQETALEAKSNAQWIAFSPFVFQATVVMRDTGILRAVWDAEGDGAAVTDLAVSTGISEYGVTVLLDFGVSIGLVRKAGSRYVLTKTGHFVLNDEMTNVNMNFTRDICYQALGHLEQSIKDGQPRGLGVFGDWESIYEALTLLPKDISASWFNFDHFYSDRLFDELIPVVFGQPVREILDIGGNTGRWALKCLAHDRDVRVTIMDLPSQLAVARRNIEQAGYGERLNEYPIDVLEDERPFYQGADVIWASQFLDCFSEEEILAILKRIAETMDGSAVLYIIELFWDRQKFEAASFSLNATSLYFTCLANGKSRMYHSDDLKRLIHGAGLVVENELDDIGVGHTVFRCVRSPSSVVGEAEP